MHRNWHTVGGQHRLGQYMEGLNYGALAGIKVLISSSAEGKRKTGWGTQACCPRPISVRHRAELTYSHANYFAFRSKPRSEEGLATASYIAALVSSQSSPTSSEKIYGKIKGPFFQYLLIFMAVFTAICF